MVSRFISWVTTLSSPERSVAGNWNFRALHWFFLCFGNLETWEKPWPSGQKSPDCVLASESIYTLWATIFNSRYFQVQFLTEFYDKTRVYLMWKAEFRFSPVNFMPFLNFRIGMGYVAVTACQCPVTIKKLCYSKKGDGQPCTGLIPAALLTASCLWCRQLVVSAPHKHTTLPGESAKQQAPLCSHSSTCGCRQGNLPALVHRHMMFCICVDTNWDECRYLQLYRCKYICVVFTPKCKPKHVWIHQVCIHLYFLQILT